MKYEDFIEIRDGIVNTLKSNKQLLKSAFVYSSKVIEIVDTCLADYEKSVFLNVPPSLLAKQDFLKLPIEERRKILEKQAKELAAYYNANRDIDGMGGGDFGSGESLRYKKDAEVDEQGDNDG